MRTCNVLSVFAILFIFSFAQSPGDQIGITWYDAQEWGGFGQRLDVDDLSQAHIVWFMMDASGTNRDIMWCVRWAGGGYSNPVPVAAGGFPQMDITRDPDPADQRTVVAYHYDPGGGACSWIDIDGGNAWGTWPNNPQSPMVYGHIWPYVSVANNNNILLASGDYTGDSQHVYLTTDEGIVWYSMFDYDSCATLSQFVRASENNGSNKIVFIHTKYITDTTASGQLDNDVWYTLSTDGGSSWTMHTNLTNYQLSDSVRAYCNVNAIFDDNDYLHIVWAGRKVDNDNYYQTSKIFHWDEYNDTITVINSPSTYYNEPGGWWIQGTAGEVGAWRLPADQPQLVFDTTMSYLYCLWHGNDDTTDVSSGGFFNGEFFGSYSTDYGITWSDYVNLTNTRTPGANAGQCDDEDYMTACPKVVNDSIFLTYIEDKDAGAWPQYEGTMTENPVRCWVFWTGLIRTGIEEEQAITPEFQEPKLSIHPNPFVKSMNIDFSIGPSAKGIELKIYDATGRLVKSITQLHNYSITWSGDDQNGHELPAGIYFVELNTGDTQITEKVVKLE